MYSNGHLYNLSHCTYVCQYHLVWATKYRGLVITDDYSKRELKRIFVVISKWKGFKLHGLHVGIEHIHMYITIPPKYSVSYAVSILKGKSSSWIKKKTHKFGTHGSIWNVGYYVSTLGLNEIAVKQYIENQDRPKLKDIQYRFV
jgi:putative transposase